MGNDERENFETVWSKPEKTLIISENEVHVSVFLTLLMPT